ncbi:MAG: TOTE conflict system archaeo-eukaryotic primase domain-containing protein, partial [Terriglobales bacterium]
MRWESAGKSGYSPARRHFDWYNHKVEKSGKRICLPECTTLPLTDNVLKDHLNGTKTIGVYPMLTNETCWFLAVDFDESTWKEDALTFVEQCESAAINSYLERSRSGNGGHVWIFFDSPMPANQARKLGAALISKSREHAFSSTFKSYDRMFPNQDTLPTGKFGNLIALPMQHESAKNGNSLFVDKTLEPFEDQWT